MYPRYIQCHSMTAWKVPRWFHDSLGIMHPWLIWWVWRWHRNVVEGLWRLEGVNILKGWVSAECVEQSHVAAENTGEHWRMLRMKFYVTGKPHAAVQSFGLQAKYTSKLPTTWKLYLLCKYELICFSSICYSYIKLSNTSYLCDS